MNEFIKLQAKFGWSDHTMLCILSDWLRFKGLLNEAIDTLDDE